MTNDGLGNPAREKAFQAFLYGEVEDGDGIYRHMFEAGWAAGGDAVRATDAEKVAAVRAATLREVERALRPSARITGYPTKETLTNSVWHAAADRIAALSPFTSGGEANSPVGAAATPERERLDSCGRELPVEVAASVMWLRSMGFDEAGVALRDGYFGPHVSPVTPESETKR